MQILDLNDPQKKKFLLWRFFGLSNAFFGVKNIIPLSSDTVWSICFCLGISKEDRDRVILN